MMGLGCRCQIQKVVSFRASLTGIVSLITAAFLPKMQLGVTIHKDRSPVTNAHSETSQ